MGIVDDDDFEREIQNSSVKEEPIERGKVVNLPKPGRQIGSTEVPDSLRQIIGETSELEGRQSAIALAKEFNISPSSVSAYANGATSTASYDTPKESIINHIQGRKDRVAGKALSILRKSFKVLEEDNSKLNDCSAMELAGVARHMAGIVKLMEPENEQARNENSKPQFVVFAPIMKDESHFEVIHSKD